MMAFLTELLVGLFVNFYQCFKCTIEIEWCEIIDNSFFYDRPTSASIFRFASCWRNGRSNGFNLKQWRLHRELLGGGGVVGPLHTRCDIAILSLNPSANGRCCPGVSPSVIKTSSKGIYSFTIMTHYNTAHTAGLGITTWLGIDQG